MEKISKVKDVQGNGTYDSQYGLLYKYTYTMDDGTCLVANHKKQQPLEVGSDIVYEIKGSSDFGDYGTVKRLPSESQYDNYNTKFSNNTKPPADKVQTYIIRQSSLTRAIEHLSHKDQDDITKENIVALADYYVNYVLNGL